jgi:hypothetical protein
MKLTVVHHDDWEALYQDGKLIHQGHSVTEQAFIAAGIDFFESPDLTGGAQGRATAEATAKTLDELTQRGLDRENAERQAAALREQAQRLLDDAGRIDGRALTVAHKDDLKAGTKPGRWSR